LGASPSRVFSIAWSNVDIDEIVWPQFSLNDGIAFDEFLSRFEDIFTQERISSSKKFACFRRCLLDLDPSLLRSSRALDVRHFDTAVKRLRPLIEASIARIPAPPLPEADINDIFWPPFFLDGMESFDDFLVRFERIITTENIHSSRKFACLQRCLTYIDPQTLTNSQALDVRRFDVAVERLRPLLNVEEQRLQRMRASYIDIAQKHNQPVESYYSTFLRLNNTHALEPRLSVKLFFEHDRVR
ncbi:hypothetical protein BGX27_009641, partial [Mortierella sp. AM989]